jgi:Ca2+-binding RTX toxin-like protein
LTAGGVATSVTATGGTTLSSIATSLRNAIEALPDYKASVNGTTLVISTEGANAGLAFVLAATAPAGSIVEKTATTKRELVLFGPAVVGDIWTVTLTVDGVTTSVSRPVVTDLAALATDLATQINLLTGFTGSIIGPTAIEVSTAGSNAFKGFSVSYSASRGFADTVSTTAASTVAVARGVPVAGEVWRVAIGGNHDHVVTAGQTLAQVVAALAKLVTDNTAFDAAGRGETIVVLGSASFAIPTRVNGAGSAASYNGGTVVVSGTPKVGETVTISLGASTHVHVVRETVPLAEIAAGLAARLNAAGISARVEGDALVITTALGSSFSVLPAATTAGSASKTLEPASTVRFTLAGSSRIGETWRVNVGGTNYDYVVESAPVIAAILAADINATGYVVRAALSTGAPVAGEVWTVTVTLGGTAVTVGYAAVTGDSLARVMDGLAGALNAAGANQFTAKVAGSDLLLVNSTALLPTVMFTRSTMTVPPTATVSVDANQVAATEGGTIVIVPLVGAFPSPAADAATVTARNTLTVANAMLVTVSPTAVPVEGETWRVTIGTGSSEALYSHVVQRVGGVVESVAQIAAILAGKINSGAVTGYTAFADGSLLVITRTDNIAIATTAFAVTPAASIVVDTTPTSRIVSFAAAGAVIPGQTWYLQIGTAGGAFAYGHAVLTGNTIPAIVLALAQKISNDTGGGGFTAFANNLQLFIVDRNGRAFTASLEIGLADGTRGGAAVLLDPAPAQAVTLGVAAGGTPDVGESWNIELTSGNLTRSYGHMVLTTDLAGTVPQALGKIAIALAAAINQDAGGGFTAFADGARVIVASRSGVAFTAQGVIVPKLRPAGSVAVVSGQDSDGDELVPAITVAVGGIPVTGAHWLLKLDVDGVTYSFDRLIGSSDNLQSIAAAFASLISAAAASAGSPLSGLVAEATAGTLLIADLGGRSLAGSVVLVPVAQSAIDGGSATTTTVDLVGTPQANEPWRLRIGDLLYEVKLGDIVGGVTLGDANNAITLAEFAAALASKLNTDPAAARYTALADGARIIIVDRQGGIFDTRLESGTITRAEGYADIQLDYGLDAAQLQARLQALYGFDGIAVTESRNAGDVTYTISFVRDQAGVDLPQIAWVETTQTTGLLPSPNASVDVQTGTTRNGALVNTGVNNLQTVNLNPNVTGGTFTLWFRIQNELGEFDLVESAPILFNATAIDVFKALSPILNPNGATIDIDEAFDFATRIPSRPYTDNFAVRKVDGGFLITFQGEHRDLVIHDIDTRLLVTQETGTTNEHQAPAATVTLGSTNGTLEADASAPRATTIDLSAKAYAASQVWSLELALRGVTSTHQVTAGTSYVIDGVTVVANSRGNIARILAASINATAADVFAATSDGEVLVVLNGDGTAFRSALTVAGDDIPALAIDRSTPAEAAVDLGGTPAVGEVWSIRLSDGATTPAVVSYTVALIDADNNAATPPVLPSLAYIATQLAAAINGLTGTNDDYEAVAAGDDVLIVRRDDTPFAVTPTIVAAGQPVQGQTWSVTLQSATSGLLTFSHLVGLNETHASVARALADRINTLGLPEFRATSEGGELQIENVAGNVFTTVFAASVHSETIGTPQTGETWSVTLGTATGPLVFSHVVVAGDTPATVAAALAAKINTLGPVEFDAISEAGVLRVANNTGAVFTSSLAMKPALAVDSVTLPGDVEAGTAVVSTRNDGINYYGIETLNIELGSGDDVFNVQGTTAVTNIDLNGGDDRIYVSSTADIGLDATTGFLPGHLHNINGALDIDAGTGSNLLMISGESSTFDNNDIVISDIPLVTEPAGTEIAIRGLTGGSNAFGWVDLTQGTITFQADITTTGGVPNGSFAGGVTLWTGFGDETISINGTSDRAGLRTITTLNTGLGDDVVTVDLDTGEDGTFVLNTQGPWNGYPAITDNDTVIGTASSLPLIVFGGQGDDSITGGSGDDILFGDRGRVLSFETIGGIPTVVESLGGGTGDLTDGVVRTIDQVRSVDPGVGGNDTIFGLEGNNIVVGGPGADNVAVGSGADIIVGDNAQIDFWPSSTQVMSARTTDVVDQPLWGDTIVTGAGSNIVLGGLGADHINDPAIAFSAGALPSSAADYVIGDNGLFNWDSAGRLEVFMSTNPFVPQTGTANPFDGIVLSSQSTPSFGDVDGDGDLDVVVGESGGSLRYYQNTATGFVELTGAANPFDGIDVDIQSAPTLADLDGDGDLDLVVGASDGTLHYYEKQATGYVELTGSLNPFVTIDVGLQSAPSLADLDGDGDLDLLVGESGGTLKYYENTATGFVELTGPANPFDGIDVGSQSTPTFVDLDSDGDFDLVVGNSGGTLTYYQNTGTAAAPVYAERTGGANPLDGIDVGSQSAPGFADLDNDGDPDLVAGGAGGTIKFYEFSHVGGDDVILVGDGNNIAVGGFGNDTITTGLGSDIVLGDNGQVSYTPGTTILAQAMTTDTVNATGGNDTIIAGEGDNLILAGVGADTVTTGAGTDLVMGDNGQFNWDSTGLLTDFASTYPALGADDLIAVGDGNNIVVGGFGNDTITTGAGVDIVLGDNGQVSYTPGTTLLLQALSTDAANATGGNDTIIAGEGNNLILAGVGADTVTAGAGVDVVMGDNGKIDWTPTGEYSSFQTTDLLLGGADDIRVGDGDNIVAGGFGTDVIETGIGTDLILGDNGIFGYTTSTGDIISYTGGTQITVETADLTAALTRLGVATLADLVGMSLQVSMATADTALGQFRQITAQAAGSLTGTTVLTLDAAFDLGVTGSAADLIEYLIYSASATGGVAILTEARTTDTTAATGGSDVIVGGGGTADNIVLAGVGDDRVNQAPLLVTDPAPAVSTGQDIVLGDNGYVTWNGAGLITGFASTEPALGGDDLISVGDGNNIVVGGFGNDTITTGVGVDVVLGDNGQVSYTPDTTLLLQAVTTDAVNATGGNDTIIAGEGDNLILAGVGADTVTTGAGTDLVLGDNGQFNWDAAGLLTDFASTDPTLGADDVIAAGDGDNIVVGGFGNDTITTGAGVDVVLGDNGQVSYTPGTTLLLQAASTDTTNATGGNDTILAGEGDNLILAGVGADTVTTGAGVDLVLGDNGQIDWTPTGEYSAFQTTDPALGANDVILAGEGDNIIAGGFGADQITAGLGQDLILGDNGIFTFTPDAGGAAVLTEARTTDVVNATGGDDVIVGGGGTAGDVILAGVGADVVTTVASTSTLLTGAIVAGDTWTLDLVAGGITTTFTYVPTPGATLTDVMAGLTAAINAVTTDDYVAIVDGGMLVVINQAGVSFTATYTVAPVAGPAVLVASATAVGTTSSGSDIVIGDNGYVNWDTAALITQFGSSDPQLGGNDLISVGDGANIVVGGFGSDTINTGAGADIVLGDDGQVDYVVTDSSSADIDLIQSTSTTAFGGADTITTAGGDDIVIGGRAGDTIDAGDGNNVVIGDSGQITADVVDAPQLAGQPITLGLIETIQIGDGGNDLLTTGTGNDIVLAGFGSDTLVTGAGNDAVFGDNGQIGYTAAVMTTLQSTDTVALTGGDDTIDAGDGNNVVVAGVGNDSVITGTGTDIVVGDNGTITNDATGALVQVVSGDPTLGGNDTLATGDGFDVAIGGAGNDLVTSAGGNDVLFGDGGQVTFSVGGTVLTIQSIDIPFGGDDTLDGAAGNDILIGGFGNDLLYGSLDEDMLFGSYAIVILTGGFVTSIVADMDDFLTAAMLGQFEASPRTAEEVIASLFENLPGYATVLEDLFDALFQQDSLLDDNVFQRVFRFSMSSLPTDEVDAAMFEEAFEFDAVTQSDAPAHDLLFELADEDSVPGAGEAVPDSPEESATPLAFEPAASDDADQPDGDLMVAALGLAGLHAAQQPQSRSCRPFERDAMRRRVSRLPSSTRNVPDRVSPI